jgi:serine/threonine-protein kinase HipA
LAVPVPKRIVAPDGQVAIAKFPSANSDTWNVMAWEKTALDLARHP